MVQVHVGPQSKHLVDLCIPGVFCIHMSPPERGLSDPPWGAIGAQAQDGLSQKEILEGLQHLKKQGVLGRWDRPGLASRAWREWILVFADIERFSNVGLQMIQNGHEQAWDRAAAEPSDGEIWGVGEVYDESVNQLNLIDHEWMHLAACVKDAVTAFEVYLEQLHLEILRVNGLPPPKGDYVRWGDMKKWFRDQLGLDLEEAAVKDVRNIRHALTHRRGELRTQDERKRWGNSAPFGSRSVHLTQIIVAELMEVLAQKVDDVESVASEYTQFGVKRL